MTYLLKNEEIECTHEAFFKYCIDTTGLDRPWIDLGFYQILLNLVHEEIKLEIFEEMVKDAVESTYQGKERNSNFNSLLSQKLSHRSKQKLTNQSSIQMIRTNRLPRNFFQELELNDWNMLKSPQKKSPIELNKKMKDDIQREERRYRRIRKIKTRKMMVHSPILPIIGKTRDM